MTHDEDEDNDDESSGNNQDSDKSYDRDETMKDLGGTTTTDSEFITQRVYVLSRNLTYHPLRRPLYPKKPPLRNKRLCIFIYLFIYLFIYYSF